MKPLGTDLNGGRDVGGRFATGTRMAVGRRNSRLSRLKTAALAGVSDADVTEIVQTLVAGAKQGDANAARLVLQLLFGRHHEPFAEHSEATDFAWRDGKFQLTAENATAVQELMDSGEVRMSDIEVTESNLELVKAFAMKRITSLTQNSTHS